MHAQAIYDKYSQSNPNYIKIGLDYEFRSPSFLIWLIQNSIWIGIYPPIILIKKYVYFKNFLSAFISIGLNLDILDKAWARPEYLKTCIG